jgi:hypothetical protein
MPRKGHRLARPRHRKGGTQVTLVAREPSAFDLKWWNLIIRLLERYKHKIVDLGEMALGRHFREHQDRRAEAKTRILEAEARIKEAVATRRELNVELDRAIAVRVEKRLARYEEATASKEDERKELSFLEHRLHKAIKDGMIVVDQDGRLHVLGLLLSGVRHLVDGEATSDENTKKD